MTTYQFSIQRDKYGNESVEYKPPNVVGFFSIDENRHFDATSSNMQYLRRPILPSQLNLNAGLFRSEMRDETVENEEKIDFILRWLIHKDLLKDIAKVQDSKIIFISYRGILTSIMKTPYQINNDWIIIATKVKNLIFFCEFWTDKKKEKVNRGMSAKEKRCCYWGLKFEQYLLSSDPSIEPDVSLPVTDFEEFIFMYKQQLNEHNVLFGAETDAVNSDVPIDVEFNINLIKPSQFVELKTSVNIPNLPDNYFEDLKLLKWWSQSFIVGIENIICGIRNDLGWVTELEDIKVEELPKRAKTWKPSVCMGVLDDFLSFVKDKMIGESDLTYFKFSWDSKSPSINAEKLENASPNTILPTWFVDECKKLNILSE